MERLKKTPGDFLDSAGLLKNLYDKTTTDAFECVSFQPTDVNLPTLPVLMNTGFAINELTYADLSAVQTADGYSADALTTQKVAYASDWKMSFTSFETANVFCKIQSGNQLTWVAEDLYTMQYDIWRKIMYYDRLVSIHGLAYVEANYLDSDPDFTYGIVGAGGYSSVDGFVVEMKSVDFGSLPYYPTGYAWIVRWGIFPPSAISCWYKTKMENGAQDATPTADFRIYDGSDPIPVAMKDMLRMDAFDAAFLAINAIPYTFIKTMWVASVRFPWTSLLTQINRNPVYLAGATKIAACMGVTLSDLVMSTVDYRDFEVAGYTNVHNYSGLMDEVIIDLGTSPNVATSVQASAFGSLTVKTLPMERISSSVKLSSVMHLSDEPDSDLANLVTAHPDVRVIKYGKGAPIHAGEILTATSFYATATGQGADVFNMPIGANSTMKSLDNKAKKLCQNNSITYLYGLNNTGSAKLTSEDVRTRSWYLSDLGILTGSPIIAGTRPAVNYDVNTLSGARLWRTLINDSTPIVYENTVGRDALAVSVLGDTFANVTTAALAIAGQFVLDDFEMNFEVIADRGHLFELSGDELLRALLFHASRTNISFERMTTYAMSTFVSNNVFE